MQKTSTDITLTVGSTGAGKTYCRFACYVCYYMIRRSRKRMICNFPIKWDGMIKYFRNKVSESELRARILIVPDIELKSWAKWLSGPFTYIRDRKIDEREFMGSNGRMIKFEECRWIGDDHPHLVKDGKLVLGEWHFSLDETHRYLGKFSGSASQAQAYNDYIQLWQNFCGEVRHKRGEIEFISQDPMKIHPVIRREPGAFIEFENASTHYDPFFKVCMQDWFNILRVLFGIELTFVYEVETLKAKISGGKGKVNRTEKFRFEEKLYDVYDSYNAPLGEEAVEITRATNVEIVKDFIRNNTGRISKKLIYVVAMFWLMSGGLSQVYGYVSPRMRGSIKLKQENRAKELNPSGGRVVHDTKLEEVRKSVIGSHNSSDVDLPIPSFTSMLGSEISRKYGLPNNQGTSAALQVVRKKGDGVPDSIKFYERETPYNADPYKPAIEDYTLAEQHEEGKRIEAEKAKDAEKRAGEFDRWASGLNGGGSHLPAIEPTTAAGFGMAPTGFSNSGIGGSATIKTSKPKKVVGAVAAKVTPTPVPFVRVSSSARSWHEYD